MVTEKQAVALAVRYSAFNEAITLNDGEPNRRRSVYVWATALDEIQTETGIVLMGMLDEIIRHNLPAALKEPVDA